MFGEFLKIFRAVEEAGIADPLQETLRMTDIISNGAVRRMCDTLQNLNGLDLQPLLERRLKGEPLEYILGRTTFMGLQFRCTPATLIPRQETELLAKTALSFVVDRQAPGEPLLVVDMCTGCGNIAVSLALNTENTKVLAVDVSPEAVEAARSHVTQYNLQSRVSLFCGDLFAPLADSGHAGRVDIVVCNPPYIPTTSLTKLGAGIIEHEPVLAFDAGPFGIEFFRRLIAGSLEILKPGGDLVFEIGEGQEKLATRLIERSGWYEDIRYYKDHSNKVRVVSAVRVTT